MKKELVGVKDLHGYWSFIIDVAYTEGKNIVLFDDFVNVVNKISEFSTCEFEQEDFEIYAFLDDNVDFCFNPGCDL
jgi:hypothetical protein